MNKLTKTLFLSIAIIGLHFFSAAHPVDVQTAQSIASKFMGTNDVQLSATYTTDKNIAAFYVFNTPDGFVIVSADDCETPIIGYSREGRFNPNNVPVQMESYLQNFVARIQYGIENHIEADETTARQWEMVKTIGRLNERKDSKTVEPLLTEMWEQGCLYNSLCPEMGKVPCGHAEVGCVAVAMGQIMHYWRYPETGWGSHSYSNTGVTLSADFGNTTYDWNHMPDSLTDNSTDAEIEAVATLLFHCGVSVDMNYTTNGSGADSGDVPYALMRYFNYSRQLHSEKRSNYSNEDWLSMLETCLDMRQPVYYAGKGDQGSHAFVCDGYDDNDLLHFNWGWGRANGYFALGNLNPIGVNFNQNNFAIFDINPQYEPWMVDATAHPSAAGTIEGTGGYHIMEQCTLTAVPAENCLFNYWKRDGSITSYDNSITFVVDNDIESIEAHFSYMPIKDISVAYSPDTNDVNSPCVSLSWEYDGLNEWNLLKQFEIEGSQQGITTDGEYIYTSKNHYDTLYHLRLRKYTMDGDLVDSFELDNIYALNITCDDHYLYCCNTHIVTKYLYCIDFAQHALVDSINMNFRAEKCTYDTKNDSFWLYESYPNDKFILVNRQGETICNVPKFSSSYNNTHGFGSIIAEDGNFHLLILNNRNLSNYDVSERSLFNRLIAPLTINGESIHSACIGKYDGKDALFVVTSSYNSENSKLYVFEINCHLARVMHYQLYRAANELDTVMLAEEYTGSAFTDTTWKDIRAGAYCFGISEVYFNGVESEIIWSDPIIKTDFGIDENDSDQEDADPSVQKVFEGGQIIIIKDGKRYNVIGQPLNPR